MLSKKKAVLWLRSDLQSQSQLQEAVSLDESCLDLKECNAPIPTLEGACVTVLNISPCFREGTLSFSNLEN